MAASAADMLIKTRVDDIVKSAEDKRMYRGLELTNGLKVLLVSDPVTDSSSAALDVHIGEEQHLRAVKSPRIRRFSWI